MAKFTFERDKDTPKKVRFTLNEGPVVGNIYVSKTEVEKYAKDDKIEVDIPEQSS
jgi:hypothetical protein